MIFEVDDEVFRRWPSYVVGCVLVQGIQPDADPSRVDALLAESEALARARLDGRDLKDEPAITVWRQAFGANGWTPSKYPSSIEALARRVARGGQLPRISPIVDLANAAALRHLVPIGAHDPAQFPDAALIVRPARVGDTFAPMGDEPDEVPDPGEIVYAAGSTVRTRRWVWRQSRDALIGPDARDVFFPVDGFEDMTGEDVAAAVAYLALHARDALAASVTTGLVDLARPRFSTVA
jgi:DNA/RNA-binding domain of Phe-tRNA-synthetase-like protein